MNFPTPSVNIGSKELASLLGLKANLDQRNAMADYALKYQLSGWELAALDARDGTDLQVDFAAGPKVWLPRLWEPDLMNAEINLGVSTGKQTRIMALEVDIVRGASILDEFGDWRSECIAVLGNGRERHFYAWDPLSLFEALSAWATPEFRWYGEGQIVLVPPSVDPQTGKTWVWLSPPWERDPQSPNRSMWRLFQEYIAGKSEAQAPVTLSWQEMYCLVSPHESLLQALCAAPLSPRDYYQGIIKAAKEVGLRAPEVLRALLWHAPWGDASQHPETWDSVEQLAAESQTQAETGPAPVESPFDLILERAISMTRPQSGGHSGPSGSFKRLLTNPPPAGEVPRQPYSKSRPRKNLRAG